MQMERCANEWEKGKTRIPRNEEGRSGLQNHHGGCGLDHQLKPRRWVWEGELRGLGERAAVLATELGRLWGRG